MAHFLIYNNIYSKSCLITFSKVIMNKSKVAVTSNSLAKRSSFRESSFVLTQANYRKLQRKVKNDNETKGHF